MAEIWNGLVSGSLQLVDGWCTRREAGLVLQRSLTPRAPLRPQHAEILRRVMSGESQKCVAAWAGVCTSAVATKCVEALSAMGRAYRSSRAPALLLLAAHAVSGRRTPPARVVTTTFAGGQRLTVSAALPDPARQHGLTPTEQLVFDMFIEGFTYEQIAQARKKSVRTVANQLAAAHRKVGEAGRAASLARLLA